MDDRDRIWVRKIRPDNRVRISDLHRRTQITGVRLANLGSVTSEQPHEPTAVWSVALLARFAALAVEVLAEARESIDALNVYPVPDGDTGTNLFLTFEAGDDALRTALGEAGGEDHAELGAVVAAYCRGLLLGARGNSGVIMSSLVGALLKHVVRAGPDEPPGEVLAGAMVDATEAGYAAVGEPVEGTILTVARAASDAATLAARQDAAGLEEVLAAARQAAREALARTPEQLEVLRRSGVVDAGGQGLCLVLDVAESAYTGRRLPRRDDVTPRRPLTAPLAEHDLSEEGPAYEVMYLLDAEDDAVAGLRETLGRLGDSLVVVGGDGLWNVHVHVDDVGAAVEAGIAAGRPHRIQVTHFVEQVAAARERAARAGDGTQRRRVVVLAFGAGLARVFREAGAVVVEASVDRRPSTGELLEAVLGSGATEVVLVPNDRDVVPTAEAAAALAEEEHGVRAAVIRTRAQVQGMAAVAVHDPARPFDTDLVEMTAAARHARSGAVTVAARRAMTSAGPCEPGDVLGAVEGDFAVVGADLYQVAVDVIERLLRGGGELFTVVAGAGGSELARRCADHVEQQHPSVDVQVYDGGQDRYPLLFGVE